MKMFFSMLLIAVSMQVSAQSPQFGVKAGVQADFLSAYYSKDQKIEMSKTGMHLGGVMQLSLSKTGMLQTGLQLTTKGGSAGGRTVRIFALELPVNFLFVHEGFFIGGGPALSYGLTGKVTKGENGEEALNVYDKKSFVHLKRFDLQLNVQMGYKLSGNWQVSAFMNNGMLNLSGHESEPSYTNRLKSIGLSAGYFF
ncbi:MAG: outer membrane beta-barrel protein [Chitinophagaceae bacterium]|nr:outer membrane beta-barrel protein [Chitinophagaceae bacterium]